MSRETAVWVHVDSHGGGEQRPTSICGLCPPADGPPPMLFTAPSRERGKRLYRETRERMLACMATDGRVGREACRTLPQHCPTGLLPLFRLPGSTLWQLRHVSASGFARYSLQFGPLYEPAPQAPTPSHIHHSHVAGWQPVIARPVPKLTRTRHWFQHTCTLPSHVNHQGHSPLASPSRTRSSLWSPSLHPTHWLGQSCAPPCGRACSQPLGGQRETDTSRAAAEARGRREAGSTTAASDELRDERDGHPGMQLARRLWQPANGESTGQVQRETTLTCATGPPRVGGGHKGA